MKRLCGLLAVVIGCVCLMTGCGTEDAASVTGEATKETEIQSGTDGQAEEGINIGITVSTMKEAHYLFAEAGAMERAKELGVSVTWVSCEMDSSVQYSQVENFIAQGVDCIVIETANSEASASAVRLAQDAGIPVINLGALIPGVECDLHLESNNYDFGVGQALDFIDAWGDAPANIVVLSGQAGDESAELMTNSLLETLEPYENYYIVVELYHNNWDTSLAMNTMENALVQNNNEIDVVFSNNDSMLLGAYQAAVNAGVGDEILFYGGDADEDMIQLMIDGHTNFKTFDRNSTNFGVKSVDNALLLINGEEPPYDEIEVYGDNGEYSVPMQYLPMTLVSSENVDYMEYKYPELFQ